MLVLGAALRAVNIGLESLWLDEVISLMLANGHAPAYQAGVTTAAAFASGWLDWQPVSFSMLTTAVRQDIHPPLYFAVLHLWAGLFGTTEAALRSLSAVGSLGLVGLVYGIARRLAGREVALAAAFVAAVSPAQIYFAQEARMYSLAMVWAALSSLSLWQLLDGGRRARLWAAAYAVTLAAGLSTHYAFAFLLAFHAVYAAVVLGRSPGRRYAVLAWPLLLVALTVMLWPPLHTYPVRFARALAHAVVDGGPASAAGESLRWAYVAARAPLRLVSGENTWAKFVYVGVFGLLLGGYLARGFRAGLRWRVDGFLWLWLAIPLLSQVVADAVLGTRLSASMRFTMMMAPPMCILLGLGLAWLAEGPRGRIPAGALALVLAVVGAGTVTGVSPLRYPAKSPAREAAADLGRRLSNDDLLVVVGAVGSGQLLCYYLRDSKPDQAVLHWTPRFGGVDNPLPEAGTLRRYRRVWLFDFRGRGQDWATLVAHTDRHLGPGRLVGARLRVYENARVPGDGLP